LLPLLDSSDPDGLDDEDEPEDDEAQKVDILRFDGTVVAIFRKLILDFNSPQIALIAGEIYSICLGAKDLSASGTVKTIKGAPMHYRRVSEAVERNCVRTTESGTHYRLRSFLIDENQLT
jgi:hypothetical protein